MNGKIEKDLETERKINEKLSTMPYYVSEWHLNLKASQKTAATRCEYVTKIRLFLESISSKEEMSNIPIELINESTVTSFFISCQNKLTNDGEYKKTSDSYQQTMWYCLNNFLGYLYKKGYIGENYMQLIERPKNKDLDRINETRIRLTEEDFQKILNAVEDSGIQYRYLCRDKAILMLFMTTGIRKTALSQINIEDVDFEAHEISVIDKGRKRIVLKMSKKLEEVLKDYKRFRNMDYIRGINEDALFLSNRNRRMSDKSIYLIVKKYSKEALGCSLSPHKLRAGFCSIMYNKTNDIEFVRRAVGHSSVTTTQRYIVTDSSERQKASDIMDKILSI